MPFTAGTFSLFATGNPVVSGTTISSSWANSTLSDIASNGLTNCMLKDGSQTLTGNIPFGGFKATGLGAGSTAGDSVRYEQAFLLNVAAGGNLIFTDATYDIGASGATRPRDLFLSRNAVVGGTATIDSLTASRGVLTDASKVLISAEAPLKNSLSGDVALNNTGSYFDGPSVANGTSGTWFVSGTVTMSDTGGGAFFNVKLYDGTTTIASGRGGITGANLFVAISVSGIITNPTGNLRIAVNGPTLTTGAIKFNASGLSADSTITAYRIA